MDIKHKGWDWSTITSESWNVISEEFLPVAMKKNVLGETSKKPVKSRLSVNQYSQHERKIEY